MNTPPHQPVLLREVIELLSPIIGCSLVDATFGAGGYSREFLANGCGKLCAIDQDDSVLVYAQQVRILYPERFQFIHDNFANMANWIKQPVDGIVFDVGVSSMQLDQAERGFSFSKSAPLDMRMNRQSSLTAYEVVNYYDEHQLCQIIRDYGGERKAKAIAKLICRQRGQEPISNTDELAALVIKAVGYYRDQIHPATRTFQALRIEVNQELSALQAGLAAAAGLLKAGGKLLVITFHSLEDTIVKNYFAKLCGRVKANNRHLPQSAANEPATFRTITNKPIVASSSEVQHNARSRSAKLRAIQKI